MSHNKERAVWHQLRGDAYLYANLIRNAPVLPWIKYNHMMKIEINRDENGLYGTLVAKSPRVKRVFEKELNSFMPADNQIRWQP